MADYNPPRSLAALKVNEVNAKEFGSQAWIRTGIDGVQSVRCAEYAAARRERVPLFAASKMGSVAGSMLPAETLAPARPAGFHSAWVGLFSWVFRNSFPFPSQGLHLSELCRLFSLRHSVQTKPLVQLCELHSTTLVETH